MPIASLSSTQESLIQQARDYNGERMHNSSRARTYAGPANVIIEKTTIALPRSIGPQRSANTPGTLLRAAEANVPVRNLPTKSPANVGVKAHTKVKAK